MRSEVSGHTVAADFAIKVICYGYGVSRVFRERLTAIRRGPRDGTKMTEKICPECNGEGVVDQGTEDERRCPTCNGSGIVPDDGQGSEEVWNTHPERLIAQRRD
jgi:DnaJ-class molecular chaperone